jgi:hypothetical protein
MSTTNLLIDYIDAAQSQKEVTANAAFDVLDKATSEVAQISAAGSGTLTLTDSQIQNAVLELSGSLTGNKSIVVPTRDRVFAVYNATTGAFTLTVKTASGTGITIDQGTRAFLYCNSTDVYQLTEGTQVYQTVQVKTYAATTAINWSQGSYARITLTGNVTFTFSGAVDGQRLVLEIIQDATGSRTITWPASVVFGSDVTSYVPSTTGSLRDFVGLLYNATSGKYYVVSIARGY